MKSTFLIATILSEPFFPLGCSIIIQTLQRLNKPSLQSFLHMNSAENVLKGTVVGCTCRIDCYVLDAYKGMILS